MNQNGGIHKGGFAVLCHRNGGSESPGILNYAEPLTVQQLAVQIIGSTILYSSSGITTASRLNPPETQKTLAPCGLQRHLRLYEIRDY